MKFVRISYKGEMSDCCDKINLNNICSVLREHSIHPGKNSIQHIHTWVHNESKIYCYGYTEGATRLRNKHSLPKHGFHHIDTTHLYGDIFMVTKKHRLDNLDSGEYGFFYMMNDDGGEDDDDVTVDNNDVTVDNNDVTVDNNDVVDNVDDIVDGIVDTDSELDEDLHTY